MYNVHNSDSAVLGGYWLMIVLLVEGEGVEGVEGSSDMEWEEMSDSENSSIIIDRVMSDKENNPPM